MTSISLISLYGRQDEYPIKHSLASMRLASAITDLEGLAINLEGFPIDESSESIAEKILEKDPNMVGFSRYIWTNNKIFEICNLINSRNKKTRIITGGPEVLVSYVNKSKNLIGVAGEGEEALKELVLKYQKNPEKLTAPKRSIPTLQITNPLFSPKMLKFFSKDTAPTEFSWWEASRGCPYHCGFCGHRADDMREYPMDIIEQEIQNMGSLKLKRVCGVDPILGGSKSTGKNVLRSFKKYAQDILIRSYMRPEFLDEEYIKILRESKIESLEIGIQTTNPNVPDFIRSNNLHKIDAMLPKLSQNGIPWEAQLITGLIGDTPEGHRESLRYVVEELRPSQVYSYHLTVIKNTPLANLPPESDLWIKSDPITNRALESSSYTLTDMRQMLIFGSAITSLYNYLQENRCGHPTPISLNSLEKIVKPVIKSGNSEILRALIVEDRKYLRNLWKRKLGK